MTLIDADRLLGLLRSEEEDLAAALEHNPDDPEAPQWRGAIEELRIIRDCVQAMAQRVAA